MFSRVRTDALNGISCMMITVQADVSEGLPTFSMVGYLASKVREAQERVRTAMHNSGYPMHPKRVMMNLAPADIRISGILGMLLEAKKTGFQSCIIPKENAPEGGVSGGLASIAQISSERSQNT